MTPAENVLWSLAEFLEADPPSPTNICAGLWAVAILAVAAYYDCVEGQVEV